MLKISSICKFVFAGLVFFLTMYLCSYIHIDSDYSNLVLEANDIISGNIFLKDWILTGISFITTDLLFFVFGAFFSGISDMTFKIAISGMIATLICLSFLLVSDGQKMGKLDILLALLLLLIPGQMNLAYLRAHTGAVCWCFLAVLCVNKILQTNRKCYYGLLFLALVLGCIGDALSVLIGLIPIILLSVVNLTDSSTGDHNKDVCKWLLVVSCLALLSSFLIDKIYFFIGGCERNSFLGLRSFEPIENWGNKIGIYIKAILMMQNADFSSKQLLSQQTLFYFANVIILITGYMIVFKTLYSFLTRNPTDTINVLLSIGFLLLSVVFIITNIAVDVGSGRYLGYVPLLFAILIVRTSSSNLFNTNYGKQLRIMLLVLAIVSFGGKVCELWQSNKTQPLQKELGVFLQENGLKSGYSNFWNASSITVLSENNVQSRAIIGNSGRVEPYDWFCKKTWYQDCANFIILDQTLDGIFGLTEESIVSQFGIPNNILEHNGFKILTYNDNIARFLYNGLEDNQILPNELFANELVLKTAPDYAELMPGGALIGPYESIEPGRYILSYYGDNLTMLTYDVFSNAYGNIATNTRKISNDILECEILVSAVINDIEFREFNKSEESVVLNRIQLQKVE